MTTEVMLPEAELRAAVSPVSARRIGLVADDHNAQDEGTDLPAEVLTALDGVDPDPAPGHMGFREILGRGVLDRLTRGRAGAGGAGLLDRCRRQRVRHSGRGRPRGRAGRVVEAGGLRIGAVHNLGKAPGPEIVTPPGGLPELAGVPVAEVVGGEVRVARSTSSPTRAAIVRPWRWPAVYCSSTPAARRTRRGPAEPRARRRSAPSVCWTSAKEWRAWGLLGVVAAPRSATHPRACSLARRVSPDP